MRNFLVAVSLAVTIIFSAVAAQAAALMPTDWDTGWIVDRYDPAFFGSVGSHQGRDNVLAIQTTQSEAAANRGSQSSSFYNTQGRQHSVTGGAGDSFGAGLHVPNEWAHETEFGTVRTDIWGALVPTPPDPTAGDDRDYPIIGFTNFGDDPRFRVWDVNAGGWVDLGIAPVFGEWVDFNVVFTGLAYEYYVNGVLAYTDTTTNGMTDFDALMMQIYNCDDPTLNFDCHLSDTLEYTVYWSPLPAGDVAEPASVMPFGMAIIFLFGALFLGAGAGKLPYERHRRRQLMT